MNRAESGSLTGDNLKKVYFVGAGGIGMAALERYFLQNGVEVGGYDRTPTELTEQLQAEGVEMTFDESAEAIGAKWRNREETLVVYTPAIPSDHPGLNWFRANGFNVIKRAALLGEITRRSKSLCFAGTHGKTTTSSMAAHIMTVAKTGCNAFLGGILRNYNSNYLLRADSPYTVVEADEYDRSFHHLHPTIAVVTATDPDHLDIYGTEESYLEAFSRFTSLIVDGGSLLMHTGLKMRPDVKGSVRVYTYGIDGGDFHAENIRRGEGTIMFDLVTPEGIIADIALGVPVEINIDNAVAAAGATWLTGEVAADDIRRGLATFMGPKRRFEFHLKEPGPEGHVIIDDYAHHPDEVKAAIMSVKALYPDRKLTVAFQPHLYSRTRDFAPQFAQALSAADEVIMVDIYPAREEPIAGVTSQMIADDIAGKKVDVIALGELVETIKKRNFEVLLTLGAGDINTVLDQLVDEVGSSNR